MAGGWRGARCAQVRTGGKVMVVMHSLDHACWKCGGATMCVVAVHLAGSGEATTALDPGRPVAAGGHDQGQVSKTTGGTYLSNGCEHCDAIQGDWSLGRSISDHGRLGELPVLATEAVTETAWRAVTANQGMHRNGYPMTWDDIDYGALQVKQNT